MAGDIEPGERCQHRPLLRLAAPQRGKREAFGLPSRQYGLDRSTEIRMRAELDENRGAGGSDRVGETHSAAQVRAPVRCRQRAARQLVAGDRRDQRHGYIARSDLLQRGLQRVAQRPHQWAMERIVHVKVAPPNGGG